MTTINIKDYGAAGDGLTDDSSTIQSAINSADCLIIPSGTYRLGSKLNVSGKAISFLGQGASVSAFLCDGDGLEISNTNLTDDRAVTVRDLSFIAKTDGVNTALKYTGNGSSALMRQLYVVDVMFRGQTINASWQRALRLYEGDFSVIRDCFFRGNTSARTNMIGAVELYDSTDVKVLGCSVYWGHVAVSVNGTSEGIVVQHAHFVPVTWGVYAETDDPGNYIDVSHNHISAYVGGVVLGRDTDTAANHSQINHNLIFKDSGSTNNFVGITLRCSRCSCVGNEVAFNGQGGSEYGIVLGADAILNRVVANNLANQVVGVYLSSGSHDNLLDDNTYIGNTDRYDDHGSNNDIRD